MGATVLLVGEAAIVAIFALAALVIIAAVVVFALLLYAPRRSLRAKKPAAAPVPIPLPLARESVPRVSSAVAARAKDARSLEIDVPTKHVDEFIVALRAAGWHVQETGDVVATDEDEEGLTTVKVDVPSMARTASGEEIR